MNNEQIANTLNQLADLLEFTGANAFRLKAYHNGARIIRELPDSIETLLESKADLTLIPGIGKGVADKCRELVQTGQLKQLQEILETVPKTVLDLLKVPKLGPKKAAVLFNELGIANLDQLKTACQAGAVRELAGFGVKTESAILDGIAIAESANQRMFWSVADQWVARLREHLRQCPAIEQLEFAGSYRRGKETVGDIDILVSSANPETVMDQLGTFSEITADIVRGETKMAVQLKQGFQVDLRVVPDESFGAALQYFTGSKDHNVIVRNRAKQLGLRINEWGVYQLDGEQATWIAGKTEAEVYRTLGLPCFEPELREARQEFEWADAGQLPKLIEVSDIIGDLHMHTTATDGAATIEEMADAARARGLRYIAITDHSKRVAMANGLDGERLLAQWRKIDAINEHATDDFLILKGIECDILENGPLDLPDSILSQADWVIASVHYGQNQTRQQITDRITGAIANLHVSMVAHPTGRLLNQREPYDVDLDAVFQAAVEHRKLLELNANPRRLDLNDVHLIAAKSRGISIVVNTDAHRISGLDDLRYGIKQARRGGLSPSDVANSRSWLELKALIGKS